MVRILKKVRKSLLKFPNRNKPLYVHLSCRLHIMMIGSLQRLFEIYTRPHTFQCSETQIYIHFSLHHFTHNLQLGLEIISKYYIFWLTYMDKRPLWIAHDLSSAVEDKFRHFLLPPYTAFAFHLVCSQYFPLRYKCFKMFWFFYWESRGESH